MAGVDKTIQTLKDDINQRRHRLADLQSQQAEITLTKLLGHAQAQKIMLGMATEDESPEPKQTKKRSACSGRILY
jgi:hypothetical protein